MALAASLGGLLATACCGLLFTAIGHRVVRASVVDLPEAERWILSAATGVVGFEIAVFLAQYSGHVRIITSAALALFFLVGATELPALLRFLSSALRKIKAAPLVERVLASVIFAVLVVEGLAAMAPVTGSDALHYHFTAPMQILRSGFHPDYFLATSFLTGQGHMLILAGLALGSDKLAMGLLYLGGLLTAAGTFCFARHWAPRLLAWLCVLAFLLTAVVFWQMSIAAVPDLWMAFFTLTCTALISRLRLSPSPSLACFCGLLAGALAGSKYTGIGLALVLLVAFLYEARSLRLASWFSLAAVIAGIWPYLRNFFWTGDPVFPFALRWFGRADVNPSAVAKILQSSIVPEHRSLAVVWKFPLFAAVNRSNAGFWEFFGPLCLAFLPIFFIFVKRNAPWRTAATVIVGGSLAIGLSSGMARYTLPIFPVALAAAFGGFAVFSERRARWAHRLASSGVAGFLALGLGGLLVYTAPALSASMGLTSRQAYLEQRSPDYAISQFVNDTLAGHENQGRVLIFFRHVYYVRMPFLFGDPGESALDADRLANIAEWREFLGRNQIRWILCAPNYPPEIAASLHQLESDGLLVKIAERSVTDFVGNRQNGVRAVFTARLLEVKQHP